MQLVALTPAAASTSTCPTATGRRTPLGASHLIAPEVTPRRLAAAWPTCSAPGHSSTDRRSMTGRLIVLRPAPDGGVIETIADPARPFYIGVQWHPERTDDPQLGLELFRRLVDAARRTRHQAG
jgi:putative glutamine amidotransferase